MKYIGLLVSCLAMAGCLLVAVNSYVLEEWVMMAMFWYFIPLLVHVISALIVQKRIPGSLLVVAAIGPITIPIATLNVLW